MEEIIRIVPQLTESQLVSVLRYITDEIEARMIQHAGEPIQLTSEEMAKLPY